jgi:hypothetical protein
VTFQVAIIKTIREGFTTMSRFKGSSESIVTIDRRRGERRDKPAVAPKSEKPAGEPRRKVQRRRQIDPTTCERDYTNDEVEFMQALEAYKRANGRMFPTCSEVLEVIRKLGYAKVTAEVTADESVVPTEVDVTNLD